MDVRTVCLGVLTLGDATGYEIRKMFEEGPFQYFTDAGFGSIYPALKRLHNEGYVTLREEIQDSRPDKKIYSITPAGRKAFTAAFTKTPGPDKFRSDFLLALFFEDLLSPDLIGRALDERIEWYREKIQQLQDCDRSQTDTGQGFVNRFGQAVYGAALEFLEQNRDAVVAAAGGTTGREAAE
jgi:DNA-binding PadR family transcriptional regulator